MPDRLSEEPGSILRLKKARLPLNLVSVGSVIPRHDIDYVGRLSL